MLNYATLCQVVRIVTELGDPGFESRQGKQTFYLMLYIFRESF